jgi:hypothetical protein
MESGVQPDARGRLRDVSGIIQLGERGYDWIHQLRKQTGKTIPELLALSRQNDPFFAGSPTDLKQAGWFTRMWEQEYKGQSGIHIRRGHYHLDAISYPKLNGMPYRNCYPDWNHLNECSRVARLLGLVPADAFDDHRNPDPYALNWKMADVREPSVVDEDSQLLWFLPSLRLNFSSVNWTLDKPSVEGYDPDDYLDRAYVLEIWVEKSTMDDILVPLTQELGVRLVPSAGYQSISNFVKLLQRSRKMAKPARILYISDCDEAGRNMPIATARQIEFWVGQYAPGADIKLKPLVLTQEQIRQYKLPRSPEGKTELDALEALRPGELARIVRQAVEPYLDKTIDGKLANAESQAKQIARAEWSGLMKGPQRTLAVLRRKVQLTAKRYEKQAARLNKLLEKDLAKFAKPLADLKADVEERAASFSPQVPVRPTQAKIEEEPGWLFDSSRSYFEQLAGYKS